MSHTYDNKTPTIQMTTIINICNDGIESSSASNNT